MTFGDFCVITLMGLFWTAFGVWSGAWLLVPMAATYTGMMFTLSAERCARIRGEKVPEDGV